MTDRLHSNIVPILIALVGILLLTLVAVGVVVANLGSTRANLAELETALAATGDTLAAVEAENATLRQDLDNVRGGVAIFTDQARLLQEQLGTLAPTIGASLDEAILGLGDFQTATIAFDLPIDEEIPIQADFVLDRIIDVPIKTELPISETFETTIVVQGPFGIDFPLDVSVPVDVTIPVDLIVPIAINETIPINTTIAVNLTVPIDLPVEGTELASLAESLETALESLREVLAGLSLG